MKNSVFALAAAVIAASASVAVAQTPISEFRGPVGADATTYSVGPSVDGAYGTFGSENRFNDFSGPVVRQ